MLKNEILKRLSQTYDLEEFKCTKEFDTLDEYNIFFIELKSIIDDMNSRCKFNKITEEEFGMDKTFIKIDGKRKFLIGHGQYVNRNYFIKFTIWD